MATRTPGRLAARLFGSARCGMLVHMTELAHRRNQDVDVALLWDSDRDELFVVVEDIQIGDRFTVTAPRERALDVFRHPFAYAAAR